MQNYDPYGESPYQRALSRPLTAPSFNPNTSASRPPDAIVGSQPATTPVTGRAPAQGVAGPAAGAPVAPTTAVPGQTPEADLAKWGYTGAIPINNVEQQAIDFVNNMYGTGGALGTLNNAQDYYNQVLQGKFGPEGKAYLEQVLNPMRASSMQNYNDMSKALATKFSDIGGYYGGRSGVAQGRLASQSANDMALNEANLRYQGFADNMNRMGGAASGLVGLGQAQSGMSGDMLNYLLSTGNMITGRDTLNRSQYQQALQNSYNDWIRARNESLMPFTWGQNLLGQEATTPIVQTQPSVWGDLIGAAAKVGSAFVKP